MNFNYCISENGVSVRYIETKGAKHLVQFGISIEYEVYEL